MINSRKLPHIEAPLSACIIHSSMINDSIAKKLQTVSNLRAEKLESNVRPLPHLSILPSISFKQFTSQLAHDLSAHDTIPIPLLILPKSNLSQDFLISEFSLARGSVNGWPIAVLRESDITNENIFLSRFISLVIDLSKLLKKSNDNIGETETHNKYLFQILPDLDEAPPLLKLFLAKMGQFHHKQRNQLSGAFFDIDKDLNTTWNSLLKLCDTEESKYLNSCKTNRIMPNIWHWLTFPYYSIFSLLNNELQSRLDKGHNENCNQPLDLFHSSLPATINILTHDSEQLLYEFRPNDSTNFASSSLKFDEFLKINCISPNSPVKSQGSPQDSFPDNLVILLPNGYPESEQQLSDIFEWTYDCYSPSDGSVLWIGNETVAVNTKENLVRICSVPQSQPLSNLSVGATVTTGQKLLTPTMTTTKTETTISDHSKKLIETSICRSQLLGISEKNFSNPKLFSADLFRAKPFIDKTTEHISTSTGEQTKNVWRAIPQTRKKLNKNNDALIEFRNAVRKPFDLTLRNTLGALLNADFLEFRECHQAFSSALTASQNTKGVIMSVEYSSLLEACETQFKLATNFQKSKTQNTFNALDTLINTTKTQIKGSLIYFQAEKNPESNNFPNKYLPLKAILNTLDEYISKEYKVINDFIEFNNEMITGLNCDLLKMEILSVFSFSNTYWNNEILQFPKNCSSFNNNSIFDTTRRRWLKKRFENTIIPNFSTDNARVTNELSKANIKCKANCSKLLEQLKKMNMEAKNAQKILNTQREELKKAEDNFNESLKQVKQNLELLNKISDLWVEVV